MKKRKTVVRRRVTDAVRLAANKPGRYQVPDGVRLAIARFCRGQCSQCPASGQYAGCCSKSELDKCARRILTAAGVKVRS